MASTKKKDDDKKDSNKIVLILRGYPAQVVKNIFGKVINFYKEEKISILFSNTQKKIKFYLLFSKEVKMGKEKKDFKLKPKASFKKGEPRFVKQAKTQIDPTTKEMRSLYNKLMQNTKSDKSPPSQNSKIK